MLVHDKCSAFEAVILKQAKEIKELKEKIVELEKANCKPSIAHNPPTKEVETRVKDNLAIQLSATDSVYANRT